MAQRTRRLYVKVSEDTLDGIALMAEATKQDGRQMIADILEQAVSEFEKQTALEQLQKAHAAYMRLAERVGVEIDHATTS